MFDPLRHFLLVAEHGTFTEAARRAHLSQPALSASIQKLEQELGAPLFERGRSGAKLTAAGAALEPHARAALGAVEDGKKRVRQIAGLEAGEVRLGAGATACTYLVPPFLAAFRKRYPGITLRVREAVPEEVLRDLELGELDLGLVTVMDPKAHGETLVVRPWCQDPLVLVAAPGLGPAQIDPASAPFVTFRRGSTSRALLDAHFPDAAIAMEIGSIASVKGNVRAGLGIALVSRSAVAYDLTAGRLALVEDPRTPIQRPMHVVHHRRRLLSPAAEALCALLLEGSQGPVRARAV